VDLFDAVIAVKTDFGTGNSASEVNGATETVSVAQSVDASGRECVTGA
jgi:hypothetical protein